MLTKDDVISVILEARDIIKSMENGPFLEPVNADRVLFVGDTHCAVDVTETVFRNYSDFDKIVFLGDYVDRGNTGIENLITILSMMINDPDKIIVLRGNHESPITNENYGFYNEITEKYDRETYYYAADLFSVMPYATVVNDYFCVHGGLASGLNYIDEIKELPLYDVVPDNQTAFELMWNDPREMINGFIPSPRGDNIFYFGEDIVDDFLNKNNLKGIIRGHETADGFRDDMNGKVRTVFSSRYHRLRAGVLRMENGEFFKDYI
ncbi:metallophosphoesterase [Picrophilus oshimae]|nr:protein phosphatase [Picrophilus oshimae DSM 9789]